MSKPTKRRFTSLAAIRLHAAADQSNPFAAKRMAMYLHKHPKEATDVAEESLRLVNSRTASINRIGGEWLKPEAEAKLIALRDSLRVAAKPKHGGRRIKASQRRMKEAA
jgi:hypothetical protein